VHSVTRESSARVLYLAFRGTERAQNAVSHLFRLGYTVSDVRGWVYVISNEAMPGLVKVGFRIRIFGPANWVARACHTHTSLSMMPW
jgi:hypothetical protein